MKLKFSKIFVWWSYISAIFIPLFWLAFVVGIPFRPLGQISHYDPLFWIIVIVGSVYLSGILPLGFRAIYLIAKSKDYQKARKILLILLCISLMLIFPQYYLISLDYKNSHKKE